MKSVIKFAPAVIAAALMASAAQAADGDIKVQGQLWDHTCTITVDGAVSPVAATVTLPTVSASALSVAGNVTGRTNFLIEVSNCSAAARWVRTFFEGGADVDAISGELINRGSATNVRLRLWDQASSRVIKVGSENQLSLNRRATLVGGKAILPYTVGYVATGAATEGTVTSTVTYTITYQ